LRTIVATRLLGCPFRERGKRAGYYVSLEITAPAERATAISAADDKLAYEQHSMEGLVKAICRNCHGGCGTVVRVKNGVVAELAGDASNPINRGKLCVKAGVASLEQLYHQADPARRTVRRSRPGGRQ
jgi:anaerobic selenocysteine-containing dehydrogenase